MSDRFYSDPNKPGRLDINGVEWWACDPYPTWYRYLDGKLFSRGDMTGAPWADPETDEERRYVVVRRWGRGWVETGAFPKDRYRILERDSEYAIFTFDEQQEWWDKEHGL